MTTVRILRLHRDVYAPVVLTSRSAGVPVEKVIEVAFRRFATLSLEEKITQMHQWRQGVGYQTVRADRADGWTSKPHLGGLAIGSVLRKKTPWQWGHAWVSYALGCLQRLFRRADSGRVA